MSSQNKEISRKGEFKGNKALYILVNYYKHRLIAP